MGMARELQMYPFRVSYHFEGHIKTINLALKYLFDLPIKNGGLKTCMDFNAEVGTLEVLYWREYKPQKLCQKVL